MLNIIKAYLGLRTVSSPICHGDRKEKWLRDIDYIEKELPKRHKNLFFDSSAEDFYQQINMIKENLENLTDDKIKVALLSLIASIKDGHSVLLIKSQRKYPIELFCFDDGIYVTSASEEFSRYVGYELTHINDFSMDEVIKKIQACVSADNQQQFKNRLMNYLLMPEILKGHEIIEKQGIFTFRKEREIVKVTIEPLLVGEIKLIKPKKTMLHLSNLNQNYWYAFNKKNNVLYFQYNACLDGEQPFNKFNKAMFDLIDRNDVKKLIVDLRHNGGGKSWLLNAFFKALRSRPHLNKKNVLYLIIGRKTFSSAMMNTVKFMKKTQATLVGEPTGGAPSGYGEIMYLNLRNTNLQLVYSTQYFNLIKGDFKAIEPDILIPSYSKDYFKHYDRPLEEILKSTSDDSKNFVQKIN